MNKVYSLDTYRQLLREGRQADLNNIEITDQDNLEQHFRNIEIAKKWNEPITFEEATITDDLLLS